MDIRTLVFILGLTHLIQILVLSLQAFLGKTYRGIGWWVLWSSAAGAGFIAMLLRNIPSLTTFCIVVQGPLIVLAVVFLYIGLLRFLDRREKRWVVVPLVAAYLAVHLFFLFASDDIDMRSVLFSVALAAVSLESARVLFRHKTRTIQASAVFLSAVFLGHGVFFLIRTALILAGDPEPDFFSPTPFHIAPYLDGILVGILWTFGLIIMVNQRLHAEMGEAKDHFELLFSTSPDAVLITRMEDGLCREVNEGFTAITGFTREEVLGRSSLDVQIWGDPADRKQVVDQLLEKGHVENIELPFLKKDGTCITGIMSAKVIELQGVPHILSVSRDITERKRAEEAVRESEEKFRIIFERSTIGKSLTAPDGTLLQVNRAFAEMLGHSAEEIQRLNFAQLTDPENVAGSQECIRCLLAGEKQAYRLEARYRHRDGRTLWADVSTTLLRDGAGTPLYFITSFFDITERKKQEAALTEANRNLQESRAAALNMMEDAVQGRNDAEAASRALRLEIAERERTEAELRASEERFRRAVEDSPFPMLLHVEDGAILGMSRSWCEITGYSPEELATIGDWTERAYGERKETVQADIDCLYALDHALYEGDYDIRTKDGSHRTWEFSSAPLGRIVDGRRMVISMAMDVTERRKAAVDLRVYQERLEELVRARTAELETSNRELDAFTYSVSHDLKAPVRAMAGFSQILLDDHAAGMDGEVRRLLSLIRENSRRMGHLIEDLLQFSRVAKGEIVSAAMDMDTLARAACEEQRPSGAPSAEVLWCDLPPAQGDQALLRQVWLNLFSNAFKFTRDRDAPRIEAGGREDGQECVYWIKDNGAGFDMRYADKLFGVFQRLHAQEEFPGTGVGLAIVQRIVHRHGGRVWAEGEVDKGAAFYFSLPTRKGNAERGARSAEG